MFAQKIDQEPKLECPKYESKRKSLYDNITTMCNQFNSMTKQSKFIYMMSSEVEVAKHVAAFIHENLL